MNMISKGLVAGVAGLAMIAAASSAEAKIHPGAAFVGGVVLGTVLSHAAPVYGAPYGVYQPTCGWHWEKQFVGYNYYGQPIYQKVKVSNCY
jgi:hypothetical protein